MVLISQLGHSRLRVQGLGLEDLKLEGLDSTHNPISYDAGHSALARARIP